MASWWLARAVLSVCVLLLAPPISAQNLAVPHHAAYVAQSLPPPPFLFGHRYRVSITMMNTGSETWTSAEGYRLGSQNPQDNTAWGLGRVELPHPVAPKQQVTFTFSIPAPPASAARDFQWGMVHEAVTWFGDATPSVAIEPKAPIAQTFNA